MLLTKQRVNDQQSAPIARTQMEIWENVLGFRISLQSICDKFNEFPTLSTSSSSDSTETMEFPTHDIKKFQNNKLKSELKLILRETTELLAQQSSNSGQKKRKHDTVPSWEEIYELQEELSEEWKDVINKWHARTHFGSEKKKSNLKVFNQTIWDQVDETMRDETRIIEKSRIPLEESKRRKILPEERNKNENDDSIREAGEKEYDPEVYDDRPFYSLLLKSFIANSTNSTTSSSHSAMRPEDLAALKSFKKSKSKVDRKASKGRKIKYVPHEKLKNFMFPIPMYSMTSNYNFSGANDVDRLYQSLFQ